MNGLSGFLAFRWRDVLSPSFKNISSFTAVFSTLLGEWSTKREAYGVFMDLPTLTSSTNEEFGLVEYQSEQANLEKSGCFLAYRSESYILGDRGNTVCLLRAFEVSWFLQHDLIRYFLLSHLATAYGIHYTSPQGQSPTCSWSGKRKGVVGKLGLAFLA